MQKLRNLSKGQIEQDLAELELDVLFLEEQLRAEFGSYSPGDRLSGYGKVAYLELKIEILKICQTCDGNSCVFE